MVLVDSSVWIEFFRGNDQAAPLLKLIDTNSLLTNQLILAELIPSLQQKKELRLIELLKTVEKIDLTIDWHQLIQMQTVNLKNGINKVGLPDLIIAQNALAHNVEIFTLDKHFWLMQDLHGLRLFVG